MAAALEVELVGQVVQRRPLSRRLLFLELMTDAAAADARPSSSMELCLKADTHGGHLAAEHVLELRNSVRVGDRVRVTGLWEAPRGSDAAADAPPPATTSTTLNVTSLTMLLPWREAAPDGRSFVPPALAAAAKADSPLSTTGPAPPPAAEDAPQPGPETQPCKQFINTGRCAKGARCRFLHEADAAQRQQWVQSRLRHRQHLAAQSGDPHAGSAKKKTQRARVFADFLVATFGDRLERLPDPPLSADDKDRTTDTSPSVPAANLDGKPPPSASAPAPSLPSDESTHDMERHAMEHRAVLDVAGGRGDVSFELHNRRGLRAVVIDPRPQRFSKQQHRAMAAYAAAAARGPCPQLQTLFNPALWEHSPHAAALQACSLVVGMHPDQATEAIVDFAVAARKPVAVVPCCVFPREFPDRRLPDGTPVTTYDQLVEYLQLRLGGQTARLPFEGANIVVYREHWDDE